MLNKFKEIEKKYPVERIKIDDIQIWPHLRIYIAAIYLLPHDTTVKISIKLFLYFLKSWHYGILNFFRKYDYFVFSSNINRRKIDDKYVDRFDYLSDIPGNVLHFELPLPYHYKKRIFLLNI